MKQRLLQLNLFLSEWKGRVPFTFLCLSLSLLGGLTMPEWKGRVPLTRSHCERITTRHRLATICFTGRSCFETHPLVATSAGEKRKTRRGYLICDVRLRLSMRPTASCYF
ncbi:hypothetical protein EVAR_66915_1 [Eumeta japonica]|uniref:Uncharacterized protein n=1 Tax=Eumeta variegata TaxID=151549 RepID=A0A4C1Z926_EUMVA|nr:hypothetical protein EVAR_66915_1 [Eumeta japonica]